MDYDERSLALHRKFRGKIEVSSKVSVATREDLSIAYTPGVAAVSLAIANGEVKPSEVVASKNTVAVITDGSAVLGLGDIGPDAALPVMEGKAVLFKEFAGIDAFPIAINTQDVDKFVETVERIAGTFGGINLEDISAPRCFEIEARLKKSLSIPVFHDDQHGTAIVTLAGLINAATVVGKDLSSLRVVISGAGAAGVAIAKLLISEGVIDITMIDSVGVIHKGRSDLNPIKQALLSVTNSRNTEGGLQEAIAGADVFIGVSKPGVLTADHIRTMNADPIIFAMANPNPEIDPEEASFAGAAVVATGRSDFPNQINNVLAFPGVFKGAFASGVQDITDAMKLAAAHGLAALIISPTRDVIIPSPFAKGVADAVARAVIDAA